MIRALAARTNRGDVNFPTEPEPPPSRRLGLRNTNSVRPRRGHGEPGDPSGARVLTPDALAQEDPSDVFGSATSANHPNPLRKACDGWKEARERERTVVHTGWPRAGRGDAFLSSRRRAWPSSLVREQ